MNSLVLAPSEWGDFEYFYELRRETIAPHCLRLGIQWIENFQRKYHWEVFCPENLRMIVVDSVRIGFVNVWFHEGNDRVGLFSITPAFQNKGIGSRVMEILVREIDQKNHTSILNVLKGSPAHRMYRKFGYLPYGSYDITVWYSRPRQKPFDEGDGL